MAYIRKHQPKSQAKHDSEFIAKFEKHLREKYPDYVCCKCNKQLYPGDEAVDRWGNLYCVDCNKAYPAPMYKVYSSGILKSR